MKTVLTTDKWGLPRTTCGPNKLFLKSYNSNII